MPFHFTLLYTSSRITVLSRYANPEGTALSSPRRHVPHSRPRFTHTHRSAKATSKRSSSSRTLFSSPPAARPPALLLTPFEGNVPHDNPHASKEGGGIQRASKKLPACRDGRAGTTKHHDKPPRPRAPNYAGPRIRMISSSSHSRQTCYLLPPRSWTKITAPP